VLRGLLEHGHTVLLRYEREPENERERAWLDELRRRPRLDAARLDPADGDRWYRMRGFFRRATDYVRFLGPEFRELGSLVEKAARSVNPHVERLLRSASERSERMRLVLWRTLRLAEDIIPVSATLARELDSLKPDVLVLVPQLTVGNQHSEYVRAARRQGIPTCMCIASWDHLTTKQSLRVVPERLVVWNEIQRAEAIELHDIPADRIAVTGAQSFDAWFDWQPRPRPEFARRVGLDPDRPFIVYLGSALFRGELTESDFVRDRWIQRLRSDERLAEVGLLVRPHPRRATEWDIDDFRNIERTAVWPNRVDGMPIDEESRADFFDSLYHAGAVAGLNTTAMIEAAVVGRTVHTILLPEFAESQTATVHFDYLLKVGGGIVEVAHTWEEHCDSLARALAGDDKSAEQRRRFVEHFVRPHGLDIPALGYVLDAIEETADAELVTAAKPSGRALRARRAGQPA
jgi:hypothetical protein